MLNSYTKPGRGKLHSYEERNYDTDNDIVKMTYTDALKHDWGGCRPTITFEYDDRNGYLLTIVVIYNRRKAKKTFAMTAEELREKILDELNNMDVWDIKGEDRSEEDLASDKRAAIQRLLDAEEDDDDEGGANT